MMALQDVLDTYGRDDFDTTMTFSTKLGSASDHTLACWGRNAQVPLSIAAIVIESSYFPIQKCMFQALCRILRALVNGNFQFEFDKIHKSLPAVICDLLPSLDHDTDRIEPLNVRDRLNILNNTLQKVFSFRIRKCWIQEGSGKPRRLGTDGWIDLGERVLSFYRDDEKSSIVCLPYSQISDIRFNTNQNFTRLFFKQGIIVSAGFAFDEEDYLTFRSCIQQCYLSGNAIEGGKVWHFGTISDSTSNVDNGFDDFDALEVTRVTHAASLIDEIVPFDNLSIHEVEVFWRSFYDNSSGFGMTKQEFISMCINAACRLNKSPKQMADDAGALFDVMTKDAETKVLDALEFLASIVFICTAPLDEKVDLVYDSWDMSDDNGLQLEEVAISLKSTLVGLSKIVAVDDNEKRTDQLDDEQIKRLAETAFRDMLKLSPSALINAEDTISCDVFHAYCISNPDVKELLVWFDTVEQDHRNDEFDSMHVPERSEKQELAMDPDTANETKVQNEVHDNGDEFMAVKPWEGAIVSPTNVPTLDSSAPVLSLKLDWIYGYHAQDIYARNNVRYTKSGDILYTAASVGVLLNPKAQTQKHLLAHTDDVLSICLHPSKEIAATGETGKTPKLIIWNLSAITPLVTLRGYHSRGIVQIAFSTLGNDIASLGADDDHSLAVYSTKDNWCTAQLTWFTKGNKAAPLSLLWHPIDATQVCSLGVKYVEFWTKEKCSRGLLGKKGKLQPFLCAAWMPYRSEMQLVVGTNDGSLYIFRHSELQSVMENAHGSSIQAMFLHENTLLTGGKDGQVKIWTTDKSGLTCHRTFDCKTLLKKSVVIQSVCMSADNSMLLIGTQESEIYEASITSGTISSPLMCGHSVDELWGLAVHPSKDEATTVGDDKWVRVWDIQKTRVVRSLKLECMARAVAYSPDGKLIAVGLGGHVAGKDKENKHPKCGGVVILYESDLSKAHERNDSKKWISDVKFSSDGRFLAVASHDTSIIIYDVTKQFTKKHIFKKHSSFVSHMDFSADGSVSLDHMSSSIVMSSRESKLPVPRWPVQGIWQPDSDGSDVNALDRSHSGSLLAIADDFGKIKIIRYPCVKKHSGYVDFIGHSSHVTNVRWSAEDRYLMSTGGLDRCLFQWKHEISSKNTLRTNAPDNNQENHELHSSIDADLDIDPEAGDEFMAVKPWIGAIVPPSTLPIVDNTIPPATTLVLEHVHGYQAQNALNNVRYIENNRIVYHAAALGIVFDASSNCQYFFEGHDDDIVSLCLHPNRKTIATGQMGKIPKIHVWDVGSNGKYVSLSCLQGFHKRSVPALSFSADGTTLASIGNDDDHSIAIYKWKEGVLIASSKGLRNTMMGIIHFPASNEWVSFGDKTITFWNEQGRNLNAKKAILGNNGTPQMFYCAIAIPPSHGQKASTLIIGTHDGSLYVFESRSMSKTLKAHKGPVYALYSSVTKLEWISGGKDGKIIIWDANFSQVHNFDVAPSLGKLLCLPEDKTKHLQNMFAIRSVCFSADNTRILIGTMGSDIVQMDRMGSKATKVTQGHSQNELWGLSIHPQRPEYCTVGDDKTLRVWSLEQKTQMRLKPLDCLARACAYSNSAPYWIAVGFGGRIGKGKTKNPKEGSLVVFTDDAKFDIIFEDKPSKEWVSEIKFSPNNKVLAVGSHDDAIYLYEIDGKSFKKRKIFRGHHSYITHFDFSSDSKFLQSNCGAYELLFSDTSTGKQITSARSMKDVEWSTWTCTLGWPVQGIWPACADGTDVNTAHRSHSKDLLITGDDFGKLKCFRYPTVAKTSVSHAYSGHSSHVTSVRWLQNDTHVISTGGQDRTVMQWKHVKMADDHPNVQITPSENLASKSKQVDEESDMDDESPNNQLRNSPDEPEFSIDAGDEFMAVKPWVGAIVPPSNPLKENPREPELSIDLEWVYGYQSELSRNNVRYNADGHIVYHAAAVGIIYNCETNTQKHHLGHSDDILCLATSPSGLFVATGEMGKKPSIRVWDAKTGTLLSTMHGFHSRGVTDVVFGYDEKTIASVGMDDDHSLAVWEDKGGAWSKNHLMTSSKGDKNTNLFAIALPGMFVTGGVKHILFWALQGKSLSHSKGQFGKSAAQQTLLCACPFNEGTTLTGAENGDLYQWTGNTVTKSVKAHSSSLTALISIRTEKSYIVVSGGKDGKVCVWDKSLQQTSTFSIEAFVNLSTIRAKTVNSVAVDGSLTRILIGTCSSDIFEVDFSTGQPTNFITRGHFAGETWGLAVHPMDSSIFLTVGDDKIARLYDRQAKKSTILMELDEMARAVAISPDGKLVAIGYGGELGRGKKKVNKIGWIGFYELSSTNTIFEHQASNAAISEVKFSASGSMAAFGSHDAKIYLYKLDKASSPPAISKFKVFDAHRSYITHIDFSRDDKYLQSNCGGYELLFCDTQTGKQIKSAKMLKDVMWDSWTCALGWPVQGIWPEFADGTDINSVCASASRTLITTGDDSSCVKVFRYPCLTKGAKFIQGKGHSSHVTNVRFTRDDKYIISIGGNDRTTMQWKLSD
ncbi:hypothetical protein LEN26_005631 [Aphanomyces euteiches]|nr:hypothetical protein LEN26_005631 [Aphanomyces euteiches]